MANNWRCHVCGSDAPLSVIRYGEPTVYLCYYHEEVCLTHLKFWCDECGREEMVHG